MITSVKLNLALGNQEPVVILAVGYQGEYPDRHVRRPLEQITHWVV